VKLIAHNGITLTSNSVAHTSPATVEYQKSHNCLRIDQSSHLYSFTLILFVHRLAFLRTLSSP